MSLSVKVDNPDFAPGTEFFVAGVRAVFTNGQTVTVEESDAPGVEDVATLLRGVGGFTVSEAAEPAPASAPAPPPVATNATTTTEGSETA